MRGTSRLTPPLATRLNYCYRSFNMQEPNESNNDIDVALLKKFQELRAMADGYIELHTVGFYDMDVLQGHLDKLRATDNTGVEWKVGYAVDEWYKLETGQWVASFPPF